MKFSVICPCYNSERYVRKAILSVLNQSYTNFELVLVNDGSTDSTLSILNEYLNNDKRIKVISQKNGGYCSAINAGLATIKGDYFLFMGSDDCLDRNLFENIANALCERNPDMIGFKTIQIFEDGTQSVDKATDFNESIYFVGNFSSFEKRHIYQSVIFRLRDTSKCFKTSLLKEQKYFGKYGYDADGIFSLLFAHKCESFYALNEFGYYMQLRKDSLSGRVLSYQNNIDRLNNWILFLNCLLFLNTNAISETDFSYASIGFGVAKSLRDEKFTLKEFFLTSKYLKTFKKLYKKNSICFNLCIRQKLNVLFPKLSYILKLF